MNNRFLNQAVLLTCFCFGSLNNAKAQRTNIGEILNDPGNNYFEISKKADAYFAQYGKDGTGWKEYNRWKFMVKNNINKDGSIPDFVNNNQQALDNFKEKKMTLQVVYGIMVK